MGSPINMGYRVWHHCNCPSNPRGFESMVSLVCSKDEKWKSWSCSCKLVQIRKCIENLNSIFQGMELPVLGAKTVEPALKSSQNIADAGADAGPEASRAIYQEHGKKKFRKSRRRLRCRLHWQKQEATRLLLAGVVTSLKKNCEEYARRVTSALEVYCFVTIL